MQSGRLEVMVVGSPSKPLIQDLPYLVGKDTEYSDMNLCLSARIQRLEPRLQEERQARCRYGHILASLRTYCNITVFSSASSAK